MYMFCVDLFVLHSSEKLCSRVNDDYSINGCQDEKGIIYDFMEVELYYTKLVILEIDIIHCDLNTNLNVKR